MDRAKVNGVELEYEAVGTGEPVLRHVVVVAVEAARRAIADGDSGTDFESRSAVWLASLWIWFSRATIWASGPPSSSSG